MHRASLLVEPFPLTSRGFASKVVVACHPECSEASGVVGLDLHRGAQPQIPRRSAPRNDSIEARRFYG